MDEAYKAKPFNMVANLLVWDNSEIRYIVFDNQYMLGVSQNSFSLSGETHDALSTDNILKVTTDYPAGWTASVWADAAGTIPVPNDATTGKPWLSITPTEGAGGAQPDQVRLWVAANTGAPRTAYITFKAGRLTCTVTVVQDKAAAYVITVTPDKVTLPYTATNPAVQVDVICKKDNGDPAPNAAWTLTVPAGATWLKLSPNADGSNAGASVSGTGPKSVYLVAVQNDIMAMRTTIIYLNSDPSNGVLTVDQEGKIPQGGSAELLYVADDGTLSIGNWGTKVTQENLLLFKFGSVIGMVASGSTTWTSSNVKFNTTGATTYGTYSNLPSFNATDWGFASRRNLSDPSYHNGTNVKNNGKGDPCKLIGLKASDIQSMTAAAIDSYNSKWHMATVNENIDFVAAPTSWYVPNSLGYVILANSSTTYWGTGPLGITEGGWFPIPGDRNAETGRTVRNTDPGGFLPSFGYRNSNGDIANGNTGWYWSSTASGNTTGYYMNINASSLNPLTTGDYQYGMTVRCVRN